MDPSHPTADNPWAIRDQLADHERRIAALEGRRISLHPAAPPEGYPGRRALTTSAPLSKGGVPLCLAVLAFLAIMAQEDVWARLFPDSPRSDAE